MQEYIDDVIAANRNAIVRAPLSADTRASIIALASQLGCENTVAVRSSDGDLVALYTSARSSIGAGRAVAGKLNQKYSNGGATNPILDPLPAPAPVPTPGNADPLLIKRLVEAAAREANRNIIQEITPLAASEAASSLKAEVQTYLDAVTYQMELDLTTTLAAKVQEEVSKQVVFRLEIKTPEVPDYKDIGIVHFKLPKVIEALSLGTNVYLYGEAGTGKTTAGMQAAQALGREFYFSGKLEDETGILGHNGLRPGEVIRTPFRDAFEHGGLFLFDEIDRSSPMAAVALNAALANKVCSFPDGVVKQHKDFLCIAAGNTRMTGADDRYTAASNMDRSTIDRFAFMPFPTDEKLEMAVATNKDWCKFVQGIRKRVKELEMDLLITPRATYGGSSWLNSGKFDWQECEEAWIWKGADSGDIAQVVAGLPHEILSMRGV